MADKITRRQYNKELIQWVKRHHWNNLEKDKDFILRHLRTFVGDDTIIYPEIKSSLPNHLAGD